MLFLLLNAQSCICLSSFGAPLPLLQHKQACRCGWHAHTGDLRRFCVSALQLPASGEAADAPRGAAEGGSAAEATADKLPGSHPGAAVVPAVTDGSGDSTAGEAAEA